MRNFKTLLICLLLVVLQSCKEANKELPLVTTNSLSAQEILDKSIEISGSREKHLNSTIQLNVDDLSYEIIRKNNKRNFKLTRNVDTTTYTAIYRNGYTENLINNVIQEENLTSKRFIESRLEGFVYLLSLPQVFKQTDASVTRLDDIKIENVSYYVLYVSVFNNEENDPSEFYLYINPFTYYVDYYAQKYNLKGYQMFFKKAINTRDVNGLLFSDYRVYIANRSDDVIELDKMYSLYSQQKLKERNPLVLKNISVEYNDKN